MGSDSGGRSPAARRNRAEDRVGGGVVAARHGVEVDERHALEHRPPEAAVVAMLRVAAAVGVAEHPAPAVERVRVPASTISNVVTSAPRSGTLGHVS